MKMDSVKRFFGWKGNESDDVESHLSKGNCQCESMSAGNQKIIALLKRRDLEIDDKQILQALDENQDCINARDKFGNSVMHLAIERMDNEKHEHIEFIKLLLKKGADASWKCVGGYTPFLCAARKNKFEAIEILVQHPGNNVNEVTDEGNTALHLAVQQEHIETVALLHQLAKTHGLREDLKNENSHMTPLDLAMSKNCWNDQIVQILRTAKEEYDAQQFGYGLKKPKECYKMSANPRGLCVIISNVTFDNTKEHRVGCQDAVLLEQTFKKLNFDVRKEEDLRAFQIIDTIKKYARMNHDDYDCFVLCISSHGESEGVCGTDGKTAPIKHVILPFATPNCKSLAGKPKLFFISACRSKRWTFDGGITEEGGSVASADSSLSPDSYGEAANVTMTRLGLEDTFEGYSTPDGLKSFREEFEGAPDRCVSVYIGVLCETLNFYANTMEFQQIILKVNEGVRKKNFHVPSPVNRLLKQIWLKVP